MPQIFLAAEVLHAANEPRLDPLCRRPLMPFRGGPARSWTRFQGRSRMLPRELMEADRHISRSHDRHQGKGRLARFVLDAEQFIFVDGVAFWTSASSVDGRLRHHPLNGQTARRSSSRTSPICHGRHHARAARRVVYGRLIVAGARLLGGGLEEICVGQRQVAVSVAKWVEPPAALPLL